MIFEEAKARETLRRIVIQLCRNHQPDEDLLQEGLIYLWRSEQRKPGQAFSWYLQGCRFHLLHQLVAGRSLDARKRERWRLSFSSRHEQERMLQKWEAETAVAPQTGNSEVMSLLARWLTPAERDVLKYLEGGFGARQIARLLGVSHQAIVKRRMRIAAMARHLGILPDSGSLKALPRQATQVIRKRLAQKVPHYRVNRVAALTSGSP